MKKFLSLIPYCIAFFAGILIFIASMKLASNDLKNLLIGVADSFLSIPLLYLFYDLTKNQIDRKLTKEIFDYAKLQIDSGTLSVIIHLQKMIYTYQARDRSTNGINDFLILDAEKISFQLKSSVYLGFQLLKNWEFKEKSFHKILGNAFILKHLENEQIILIIKLIKSIRNLEKFYKNNIYFEKMNLDSKNHYLIVSEQESSSNNHELSERYLLLRKMENEKFVVEDFGDFNKADAKNLLLQYKIKNDFIPILASHVNDILEIITKWLRLTGNELLLDEKLFKTVVKSMQAV